MRDLRRAQDSGRELVDVAVVIPTYNEEAILPATLVAWRTCLDELGLRGKILVVDDGSTDLTVAALAEQQSVDPGLRVLKIRHGGHCAAVVAGYRAVLRNDVGWPSWVIQADADQEVPISSMRELWDQRCGADIVLGRRIGRRRLTRRIISRTAALLVSLLWSSSRGQIDDPNVPFRLIRAAWLAQALDWLPSCPASPNLLLAATALQMRARVVQVPVPFMARDDGRTSLPRIVLVGFRSGWQLVVLRTQGSLGGEFRWHDG